MPDAPRRAAGVLPRRQHRALARASSAGSAGSCCRRAGATGRCPASRRCCSTRCGGRCAASAAVTAAATSSTTRCSAPPAFVDFVLEWWPPLDATEVLGWLRDPELLARVAEGVLSTDEQALLSKSWGPVQEPAAYRVTPDDWSVEDVALLDELRYQLGDVPESPARRPRHRARPGRATSFDENVPELTTVGRPRARHGSAHHGPHRGRRLRPRARRRGAGPHADAVADGRPARPRRHLDRRRRPGAVVVAGPARTPAGPARRRSATSRATTSTCRRTTATARRSTTSRPRTPRGWVSTPTCPNAVRETGIDPVERQGRRPGRRGPRGRHRDGRRRRGHGRHRGAGRPARAGAGLARQLERPRGRRRRRRRWPGSRC